MRIHLLLLLCSVALGLNAKVRRSRASSDGYTNNLGTYVWFNEAHDSVFTNGDGHWQRVSSNYYYWNKALTIRAANIKAMMSLGFDSNTLKKDIILFDGNSPLFTKHSKLLHPENYIVSWKTALNSDNFRRNAKKSEALIIGKRRTGLSLKYYPRKARMKNVNALGLVKSHLVFHSFEAGMEMLEHIYKCITCNHNPHSDPIYDANMKNARRMLRS